MCFRGPYNAYHHHLDDNHHLVFVPRSFAECGSPVRGASYTAGSEPATPPPFAGASTIIADTPGDIADAVRVGEQGDFEWCGLPRSRNRDSHQH